MSEPGRFFIAGMRIVPKKPLSKAVRRLASVRSQMAVRRFAAHYGAAVEEAEKPLEEYTSLLDFFTRRLKPGARPVDPHPDALVSPVDAQFLVGGAVGEGTLVQAKGKTFSLDALLAEEGAARTFGAGGYLTMYLSPRHYHRIHSPVDGVITGYVHIPGALFPVNAAAVHHVDELFSRNERLITWVQSERFGRVAVIKVGATNVGHIRVAYDPEVATNTGQKEIVRRVYERPIPIARGDEVGVFEMGSTVIVVTERGLALEHLEYQQELLMGQRLGVAR